MGKEKLKTHLDTDIRLISSEQKHQLAKLTKNVIQGQDPNPHFSFFFYNLPHVLTLSFSHLLTLIPDKHIVLSLSLYMMAVELKCLKKEIHKGMRTVLIFWNWWKKNSLKGSSIFINTSRMRFAASGSRCERLGSTLAVFIL